MPNMCIASTKRKSDHSLGNFETGNTFLDTPSSQRLSLILSLSFVLHARGWKEESLPLEAVTRALMKIVTHSKFLEFLE
jgi:hypothetical protein